MSASFEAHLPTAPFRAWLLRLWKQEADRMGLNDDPLIDACKAGEPMPYEPKPKALRYLGPQLAMSTGLIRYYLNPAIETVGLKTVDRTLSRQGDYTLDDVYGTGTLEATSLDFVTREPRPRCRECGTEMRHPAIRCGFCTEERKLAA